MKIPLPTQIMLQASKLVQAYWWMAAVRSLAAFVRVSHLHAHDARAALVGHVPSENAVAGRCAAQSGNRAFRARHGDAGGEQRAAGAIDRHLGGDSEQPQIAGALESVAQGVKRGEGIAGPLRERRRCFRRWPRTC